MFLKNAILSVGNRQCSKSFGTVAHGSSGGVSEIAIEANMCKEDEEFPDISNPEVDNGQSVNRCEIEEAESLFQTILQRAHFKLIRGGDGLMLRDVPIHTLYPTMLAAVTSSSALLFILLFAEYVKNPGTRAVSKAIDLLCGQAMTSNGLPNAAFSAHAGDLSFGVAIRQYRNRSTRDGFFRKTFSSTTKKRK